MATYYPTNKQSGTSQQNIGGLSTANCVWEIGSATLATTDLLQGPTIPANAVIVGGFLAASDVDTGTTVTFSVGEGTTVSRFLSASTIGRSAGIAPLNIGGGYKTTASTRIDVTPLAAAAGGVSGGTIALSVSYIVLESTS